MNNTDIWTREGAYGLAGRPEAKAGWRGSIDFPRIQGGDIVGRITAVGAGVDPRRVGQRVMVDPAIYDGPSEDAHPVGLLGSEADGGFAQYTVAAVLVTGASGGSVWRWCSSLPPAGLVSSR
jgi:NADPH:quinone reductase-like Zn-dependent oxidoreductase